jgi:hypothetical protein
MELAPIVPRAAETRQLRGQYNPRNRVMAETTAEEDTQESQRAGLCRLCTHARTIAHPHGGDPYYRCELSDVNPAFPKYPTLPVTECPGFEIRHERVD